MIDIANKYESELKDLFYGTWYDEKYKFYGDGYNNEYVKSESNWNQCEFVSKDSNGSIIGYITYQLNRVNESVTSIAIINFTNNKITFGLDLFHVLNDLFIKYNVRKISFTITVGNPIEKMYDKFILKYGGRIVGIKKEETMLYDGQFYDNKIYEIFKTDYLKNKL